MRAWQLAETLYIYIYVVAIMLINKLDEGGGGRHSAIIK